MENVGNAYMLHNDGVTEDVWVQRDYDHVDLGLENLQATHSDWGCLDLTPTEARKVAQWLLAAADEAEWYTPDE